MRLDHVVLLVHDLNAAERDWRALGFAVAPGGRHDRLGSRNALVPLADGSYLELVAFPDDPAFPLVAGQPGETRRQATARLLAAGASRFEARWLSQAALDEGLCDVSFAPDPNDPAETVEALRARGLDLADPLPMGRTRPDGFELRWRMIHPDGSDLPFLVADDTERGERVPAAPTHENGATGVATVALAVRDAEASADRWRALLGTDDREARDSDGRPARAFRVGGSDVLLVAADADPTLGERVAARGESVYLLELAGGEGALDAAKLHGADVRWAGSS